MHGRHGLMAWLAASLLAGAPALTAQQNPVQQNPPAALHDRETFQLWPGQAPGALGGSDADVPTLTAFLPSVMSANMPAVVICPGGAYFFLATKHEGDAIASYFNLLGIPAFVLKYRIGPAYHHPIELGDAQRAIRMVRAHAAAWHIAPNRIGVVGFSAGGHLAMTASIYFDSGRVDAADSIDRVSSRPDFAVLGYGVLTLHDPWTHKGSRTNLLGEHPDTALVSRLSGEVAVTAKTPPTFIFTTNADKLVPAENSILYMLALRRVGVPAELHVFQNGPHGVGIGMTPREEEWGLAEWPRLLSNWLRVNGFR